MKITIEPTEPQVGEPDMKEFAVSVMSPGDGNLEEAVEMFRRVLVGWGFAPTCVDRIKLADLQ
jgi:hypothetical protein